MLEINKKEIEAVAKEISNIKLFLKYCIGGGLAFITDATLLFVLTEYAGIYYLVSEFFAFVIAAVVNYSFNRKFTFRNTSEKIIRQFAIFVLIASGGLCLDLFILRTLVEKFGIWYMFAKVIAAGIVLIYNFTGNKLITFKILQ